ncbi:Carbohydrate binding module (family 35) [Nonomuraea solani]|uniref:Carbohydrate binding module (Family 35) n=1 Tax=Nonomuraea solani TaxID=1144553 RepID=A0A1H6EC34_9ACTN|nr:PQQ-dependent sugar dehydrogenase [Nonomuraea solani]SEG95312.1 Carbohydrate binding module (family 35) [Nonomuraea solani]
MHRTLPVALLVAGLLAWPSQTATATAGATAGATATASAATTVTTAAAASVVYEAENAAIVNGVVESEHAGYSGTGFVNSANAVGPAVEFTVQAEAAGSTDLAFRYANGGTAARPATLTVNGATHSTPRFAATGAWTTWSNETVSATLNAGANVIRITATTSGGLANIDALTVGAPPGDGPIADPIPQNPIQADLGLVLTEYAQFPRSEPVPTPTDARLMRHARINHLSQLADGRRVVPDLNGRLYTMPPNGGPPATYLDVRATVGSNFFSGRGLGSGLGFVAFHPEFAANGRFYTVHSEAFNALTSQPADWTQPNAVVQSVVTEWTAANPAAATFSGTRRQLLRLGFGTYIHAVQQIDFNPNAAPGGPDHGLLYVAVGDGGIGVSSTVPQQRNQPFGKILRIDPRGTNSTNGRYGIPASNPFIGRPGTLGEIYALGMRDPHRFGWDRGGTGRMFLGHIGEHDIEGVYDVRPGDNLGWSEREGAFVFDRGEPCYLYPLPANDAQLGYTYPVAAYDHNGPPGCTGDLGRAIAGGFVYRGPLTALRGKYIFGDLVQGWVFATNEAEMTRGGTDLAPLYQLKLYNAAGTLVTMRTLAGDDRVDLRIGMDRAGDLFILSKANGKIWKVTGTR